MNLATKLATKIFRGLVTKLETNNFAMKLATTDLRHKFNLPTQLSRNNLSTKLATKKLPR